MGKVEDIIVRLYDVGAVIFGSFTLKSGIISPIYFDLRVIVSHPELMQIISELLEETLDNYKVDVICGVPYTALPLATIVSVNRNIPMVIKRKEQKEYGTGKLIEGEYEEGKTKCLIIEDVVTTGSSIVETSQALRNHGIIANEAVVVLNRNFPVADNNLKEHGVQLNSLVKVDKLLQVLLDEKRITQTQKTDVEHFLAFGQAIPEKLANSNGTDKNVSSTQSIAEKLKGGAKQIFDIIISKQSNLCLSADCENWQQVLKVTEACGSKICAVKTHIDAINFKDEDELATFKRKLVELAMQHNFVIIEDRKFADIGSTVEKQLTAKPFTISEWAHFVTVHSIPGPGMLKVFQDKKIGVILIAEMSSAGNLPSLLPEYKQKTLEMCDGYEDVVVGFVSQSRIGHSLTKGKVDDGKQVYLQFTPGVSLQSTGDSLGQQYVGVKDAILERDADIIIVGRGIIKEEEENWPVVAEEYRKQGWEAFLKKMNVK